MFPEEPTTAVEVARLETAFRMVQSKQRYTFSDRRLGIEVGQRERSYCIFQIHEPVWLSVLQQHGLEDYRTNVESCVKAARLIYDSAGQSFKDWATYVKLIAMRN